MSQPPQGGDAPQDPGTPETQPASGSFPQRPPVPQGPPGPGYPPPGHPYQGQPYQGQPGPAYAPQGYGRPGYPPQPGPGQPPPGSPSYPPQAYPGQPYGPGGPQLPPGAQQPPAPDRPQPEKRSRTGLLVLVGALALALVLAVVAVAVHAGRSGGTGGAGTSGGGASAPAAGNASDAVQGFLEAVAANDAARALALTDQAPADKTFLTDAALQASSKLAPLSDISVPPVTDAYAYKAAASFSLGGKPYARDFTVEKAADGWKVTNGVSDVDVSYQRQETLPMIVNGTKVTSDTVSLFPGTYAFTTGSRWLSYGSSNVLTVAEGYPSLPTRLRATLTKAGSAEVLAKTRSAFRSCLGKHELRPSGCPNRITDTRGVKVKEGTVRWRVTNDPFRNAKVAVSSSDPTIARGTFYPEYRIKFTGTQGGRTGSVDSDVIGLTSFESVADLSRSTVKVRLEP